MVQCFQTLVPTLADYCESIAVDTETESYESKGSASERGNLGTRVARMLGWHLVTLPLYRGPRQIRGIDR